MSNQSENLRCLFQLFAIPMVCAAVVAGGIGFVCGYVAPTATVAVSMPAVVDRQPLPVLNYFPTTPAEARSLRGHDVEWTNRAIRVHYLNLIQAPSLEFVARRAYVIRHNARLTCRAMMEDPAEVKQLQERDRAKYGSPDGPTFDWLVRRHRMAGKCGDEVFQAIIDGAGETDPDFDAKYGAGDR
jgi:hypothetical protein